MNVRLPRSFTFRLALTYMSLFGVSVLLLMLFIYWSTASYMARQSDALIEAEIGGLAERYDLLGLDGLIALIKERLSRQPTGLSIYLLTTDDESTNDYWLTRIQFEGDRAVIEDLARIPFPARALAFDGRHFWTNHRERHEMVCFARPD